MLSSPELKNKEANKKPQQQKNYAFMIYNECKNLSKPLIAEIKRSTLHTNAI